jgi:hypothetical protein
VLPTYTISDATVEWVLYIEQLIKQGKKITWGRSQPNKRI